MKHILTIGKNRILFKPTTGLNYRPNRGMVGRGWEGQLTPFTQEIERLDKEIAETEAKEVEEIDQEIAEIESLTTKLEDFKEKQIEKKKPIGAIKQDLEKIKVEKEELQKKKNNLQSAIGKKTEREQQKLLKEGKEIVLRHEAKKGLASLPIKRLIRHHLEEKRLKDFIEDYKDASEKARERGLNTLISDNPGYKIKVDRLKNTNEEIKNFLIEKARPLNVYSGEVRYIPDLQAIKERIEKKLIISRQRGLISRLEEALTLITQLRLQKNKIESEITSLSLSLYDKYKSRLPKTEEEVFAHAHQKISIPQMETLIDKYWEKEFYIETLPIDLSKHEEINNEMKRINETVYIDDELNISTSTSKKLNDFSDMCVNDELAHNYLTTEGVDEEIKSGKGLEFAICGINNPCSTTLFGIPNPCMRVSDFIIEKIYLDKVKPQLGPRAKKHSLGKQFCIDNIDIPNLIMNEMKDYKASKVDYVRAYNAQIKNKECFLNNCKLEIVEAIENEDYETLEKYTGYLKSKESFDKAYYKLNPYIGVPITMNKWDKIKVPVGYDYNDSPNSKVQIDEVIKHQGQKFTPHMKDRKIISITQNLGESMTLMNQEIQNIMFDGGREYVFTITVRLGNSIVVYNYTNDDLVKDDFILGTYRTALPSSPTPKYNGVLIPIEKFIPKGL